MGKREGKVENALVKRIEAIGGLIRKAQWVGRRGCPDRFVMLPTDRRRVYLISRLEDDGLATAIDRPRNPWVECKATGEPLDGHQEREIRRMRSRGELVLVIDSQEQIDRYFPLVLP